MSFTGLIEKDYPNPSDSTKEYFTIIKDASVKMSESIDNILTISKLDLYIESIEMIEVEPLEEQVKLHFQQSIQIGEVSIDFNVDQTILGFRNEFEKLLLNLMGNAI